MTQLHVRTSYIDTETLDELAARAGCESKSEYVRRLIVSDARERGVTINDR